MPKELGRISCLDSSTSTRDPFERISAVEIFSSNGSYYNDPGIDLSVDVTNGLSQADFTFYNNSTIDCSITRIYFDDGTLLGIDSVENGPGTQFDTAFPGPGNLPNANLLFPAFVADREFNIGAESSPPENGVNNVLVPPQEWVKITFALMDTAPGVPGTLADILEELENMERPAPRL